MIYFPASQGTGGIAPKLPFEPLPVYPVWVVPYYLTYIFWLVSIIVAIRKFDDRTFRAWLAGALFVIVVGISAFWLFPTYIELPAVTGADIFSAALRYVQSAGGDHAALPSAHNYLSIFFVAFAVRLYPKWRWVWIAILVSIVLSTILTGQHYLLDVVTGLALGWLGYKFGWTFLEGWEGGLASHHS